MATDEAAVNQSLPLCGGDVTRACTGRVGRQSAPLFESCARVCDTHTTSHMIPAHGTYVALRLLHESEHAYLRDNNKKKRKRLWSRRTHSREMIHGLRPVHVRNTRLCLGQTRRQARRFFPPAAERDLCVAPAPGRARDRALSSKQQVHRRGRARDRAALLLDALTHATHRKGDLTK